MPCPARRPIPMPTLMPIAGVKKKTDSGLPSRAAFAIGALPIARRSSRTAAAAMPG